MSNISQDKINESKDSLNKIIDKKYVDLVEKSIRNFSEEYALMNDTTFLIESIYETKLDELLNALTKNPDIIKSNNDAEKVAFLKPEELNPDNYEKLLKKKELEEYKKNDVKSSSAFKCSKCKKNKCSVTQKQIRAGDEPATVFVTCLECGHTFSFN